MNQYKTYKPSGIEWIGDIPEHWNVKRLKYKISYQKGKNPKELKSIQTENSEIYLAMDYLRDNSRQVYYVENPEKYIIVNDNDILLLWDGSNAGEFIKSKKGVLSSTMAALTLTEIDKEYTFHYLKTLEKYLRESTIGMGIPHVNGEEFKNSLFLLPTINEQANIAAYLDRKTAKIDRIITNKQKLVALYEEEKTSIINHAITYGINKSVAFKDSGVEWLGKNPEHWKVKKLGYMGQCQNGISIDGNSFGSGYPFVSYGDVYKNVCLPISVKGLVNSTEKDRVAYSVEEGDIFFTRTSETSEEIGIASVCISTIRDATFAGFLIRFRPYFNLLVSAYSKYYFRSQLHRYYFVKEMNIVTRASLSQRLLRNLIVLLPPLEEQSEIANYLDKECNRLDTLIQKYKKQIELFQEYRSTLISQVVTGKIKVME